MCVASVFLPVQTRRLGVYFTSAFSGARSRNLTKYATAATNRPLLIVGLGNPGATYKNTRHNVGFEAVDLLASRHGINWSKKLSHKALTAESRIGSTKVVLCKPMAFMNVSGESVAPVAKQHGIPMEQIIVLYDDLDSELGVVKMKQKGGHGGHNGVRSIIQRLGNQKDFPRIKIGIGRPSGQMTVVSYVLSKFRKDEQDVVVASLIEAVDAVEAACSLGLDLALSGKRL